MYYVYSLKCKDGYYIGCANDPKDRIGRHQKGQVSANANRLLVELDFYSGCPFFLHNLKGDNYK